jgi:Calponin homology (CH) domain
VCVRTRKFIYICVYMCVCLRVRVKVYRSVRGCLYARVGLFMWNMCGCVYRYLHVRVCVCAGVGVHIHPPCGPLLSILVLVFTPSWLTHTFTYRNSCNLFSISLCRSLSRARAHALSLSLSCIVSIVERVRSHTIDDEEKKRLSNPQLYDKDVLAWVNGHLQTRDMKIGDLEASLSDGVTLCALAEVCY